MVTDKTTAAKTTAAGDLAFLRQLVSADDGGATQRGFGAMYTLWGAAFAVPLFVQWFAMMGWIALPGWYWIAASALVTVILIVVTIVIARRSPPTVGVQAKAWNSAFSGIGFANIAVLVGLILAAGRLGDGRVMMIHGLVVYAFQGAAWYVVWALRRRAWTGVVAGGWFVAAAALGATIPGRDFVLVAALGLVLLMVVPGLVMLRTPKAG